MLEPRILEFGAAAHIQALETAEILSLKAGAIGVGVTEINLFQMLQNEELSEIPVLQLLALCQTGDLKGWA